VAYFEILSRCLSGGIEEPQKNLSQDIRSADSDLNSDPTNATAKISTANSVIFGVSPTARISPKAIKHKSSFFDSL
jgi:hypothetical protein